MSSKFQICSSLAILLVIVVMAGVAEAADTKFVSARCNTKKIPRGSHFYNNLRNVLQDLKQNTAYNSYDYKTSSGGGGGAPTAYGHATCKESISESDCTSCVSNASDRIYDICSNAVGARVQLVDCYLQYEQHKF